MFETSNKLSKILLKGLNPHVSKFEGLNWTKVFDEGLIPIFIER